MLHTTRESEDHRQTRTYGSGSVMEYKSTSAAGNQGILIATMVMIMYDGTSTIMNTKIIFLTILITHFTLFVNTKVV